MNEKSWQHYSKYFGARNLNLGSAKNHEPSRNGYLFVNLDMNPETGADIIHDLRNLPLPFEDNSFDSVVGSHIFEHISKDHFLPLVADIHRILKPDGALLSFTPYGTSFDAFDNPHHLQQFSESTWFYVCTDLYERQDNAGFGADQGQPTRRWSLAEITMVPWKEFENDPEIDWKRRHYLNVIQELHVVLRALK